MPLELKLETFTPLVGEVFGVTPGEGAPFEVVLSEVEPTPYGDPAMYEGRRMPFSLFFHARAGEHVPQQTCRFVSAHGEVELFVVPLGPEIGKGMRYEAVIS